MKHGAPDAQIDNVIAKLKSLGFQVHPSRGVNQTVLGAIGDKSGLDERELSILDGVREVIRVSEPYKLVSRPFHPEDTVFKIKDVVIGGNKIQVMAGPCAVESEEQMDAIAKVVVKNGAAILRGGAYKPRTSPYSFQGLGIEGLKILRKVADQYGLLVITEVIDRTYIDEVAEYADILQIGARNMSNFAFLRELGETNKTIFIKRGMAATIQEWLMACEYLLAGGNNQVILCERGIRTFETYTRNTMDISAIPVVHKLSHLPIFADPSHATGLRDKVMPMARAAVAAGADGIMVEIHTDPEHAKSDGPQSLYPDQFEQLMKELKIIAKAVGREI
jgi:3-deoxy-7-phosphoheptulonate synthase